MELISCIKNFPKHCKTALQNIWRNGVMSVSSIFAVTITLVLILIIGVVAINIQDMTLSIEESLTVYVKMERDIDDEDAQSIEDDIEAIAGFKSATFSSNDKELDKLIESAYKNQSDIKEKVAKIVDTYTIDKGEK